MKISREAVVERAIMITMTARDMEACIEHFELYSSATRVLERNSEGYSIQGFSSNVLDLLGRSITGSWCSAESVQEPFSQSELRKAIAGAFRLARKELKDENHNK